MIDAATYPPDGTTIRDQVLAFHERAEAYVAGTARESKTLNARAKAIAQRMVGEPEFQHLDTRALNERALDDARQEYGAARTQEAAGLVAASEALLGEISAIEVNHQTVKLPPVTVGESEAVTSFDRTVIREQRETRRSLDMLVVTQEYVAVRDVGELLQALEVETAANNLLAVVYLDGRIARLLEQASRRIAAMPANHPERVAMEPTHRQHERELAKIRAARMPADRRDFWARRRAEIQAVMVKALEMAADEHMRFNRGPVTDDMINRLFMAQRAARSAGTRA